MNALANIHVERIPFDHQLRLAESFAKSGLFGVKTADQALALMALCEADGIHPAKAIQEYHIIQGKPALKADAMMARFQAAGGRVKWIDMTDDKVSAEFSHPSGGAVVIDWDKDRAVKAGFWGKDNWKKFPRAMLRSRVVSEGIRTVFPGVVVGVYTPEEVQDFDEKPEAVEVIQHSAGKPQDGMKMQDFPADRQVEISAWSTSIAKAFDEGDVALASKIWKDCDLPNEEKAAAWFELASPTRTAIKKYLEKQP